MNTRTSIGVVSASLLAGFWAAQHFLASPAGPEGKLESGGKNGIAASRTVEELARLSDEIILIAQDGPAPADADESLLPGGEDENESLLPGGETPTDEGESLLPGGVEPSDEGESLLPGGVMPSDGEGESLLPGGAEGDELMLPEGDEGLADLSFLIPEGVDPPTSSDSSDSEGDEVVGLDAATAHTTYLKWLEEEEAFPTAVSCAACHPDHFAEWSISAHAYAQMSPVFNSMHATILKQTAGTNGDFCIRCHTQIGMQRDEPLFTSNLNRHPASIEGITCVVCHRVDRNFGKVSGRTAIVEGNLLQPVYGPKGNEILKEAIKEFNIQSESLDSGRAVHKEAKKFDPITTSGFCGSCHDVNLLNGFRLEEAFSQFKNSPSAKRGENCQDCHMGVVPGFAKKKEDRFPSAKKGGKNEGKSLPELRHSGERDYNYAWAPAAQLTEEKTTPARKRTNHMFAGPDYSIIHPGLFPHSPALKEFTYEGRRFRHVDEVREKAEEAAGDDEEFEFDGTEAEKKAEEEGIEMAKKYALADWLSFRWEEGWGTEAFEEKETERAKEDSDAHKDGKKGPRKSYFANLPEAERKKLEAAGWHHDDPTKWRKGRGARIEARKLLDQQFQLLNRINVERHQIWRRGLQLGKFQVRRNDSRGLDFRVEVVNGTDGHGVPTGFDAERLVYLHVTVRDRDGKLIFVSGDRDPNGDVRDLHSAYVHAGKLPIDKYLFNLQSKFLTRNVRGGEQEQVLAVNHSPDPLPYIRPDVRPGILVARPAAARKQAKGLPPNGSRWAEYKVSRDKLTGRGPYTISVKVIAQMVPVNLVKEISGVGFDYNLSAREVAKRVVFGHRVSPSTRDADRRAGALTVWDKTLVVDGTWKERNFTPSEAEIMAEPSAPFPLLPPPSEDEEEEEEEMIDAVEPELPPGEDPKGIDPDSLLPGAMEGDGSDDGENLLPPGGDDPSGENESLLPLGNASNETAEDETDSLLPPG